jgi:predicted nucleic acid-binding protein
MTTKTWVQAALQRVWMLLCLGLFCGYGVLLLAFDRECAAHAARIRVELETAGTPIGPYDTLIAATAVRYQATLVTRNVRAFSRVAGLR